MGAAAHLAGPVRAIPRYLNPDLTINRAAIDQAAEAYALARVKTAGRPRSYRVGRRLHPMRVRTEGDLFVQEHARLTAIAKGMAASERHFRRLDAADAAQRHP